MKKAEHIPTLHLQSRESEIVSLKIPTETIASIKKVAESRDMSPEALMKFYIGQGLRQDLSKLFAERVIETTAQVLTRHVQSKEEISLILREIELEAVGQRL